MARPPGLPRLLGSSLAALLLALTGFFVPAMAAEVPLAIKGYDPVAYFTDGRPVPGQAQFEYQWDEQRYRFSSVAHMAAFKANPARYMPRFGNICAGALAFGLAWEANPEVWKIHEGRLYLFGSTGSREAFEQDPEGIIKAARRNDARLHKGQPLVAEVAFPQKFATDAANLIRQCRLNRTPACPPESELAELERLLNAQPKMKSPKPEPLRR